jgi:hypothetical protein
MNTGKHEERESTGLERKKGNQVLLEIERHHSVQDSCKFYKLLNNTRKPFEPAVAICCQEGRSILNKI